MRIDALNIDALTANAYLWRGTPFHANSCARGPRGGVCCHLLVHALYKSAGLDLGDVPLGPPGHARSGVAYHAAGGAHGGFERPAGGILR